MFNCISPANTFLKTILIFISFIIKSFYFVILSKTFFILGRPFFFLIKNSFLKFIDNQEYKNLTQDFSNLITHKYNKI